jgi:hypothetical protein
MKELRERGENGGGELDLLVTLAVTTGIKRSLRRAVDREGV